MTQTIRTVLQPSFNLLLFGLLCFGQILDVASTYYGIYIVSMQEGNPVIQWLINRFGFNIAMMLKLLLSGSLGYILMSLNTKRSVLALKVLTILSLIIVPWNILAIIISS